MQHLGCVAMQQLVMLSATRACTSLLTAASALHSTQRALHSTQRFGRMCNSVPSGCDVKSRVLCSGHYSTVYDNCFPANKQGKKVGSTTTWIPVCKRSLPGMQQRDRGCAFAQGHTAVVLAAAVHSPEQAHQDYLIAHACCISSSACIQQMANGEKPPLPLKEAPCEQKRTHSTMGRRGVGLHHLVTRSLE